ncbi:hypothetical protein PIB30_007749 [Stylosanthes scabra]|uniref:Uncharacterized protein n=1 Tax=Stylosanthes scabra TaxID=79078 RepID=A0ABU6Y6C5_9FABA|nr:hypothetical protein [Stylosanthes scabra]
MRNPVATTADGDAAVQNSATMTTVSGFRDQWARRFVSPIGATPPPLLASVFPWDRGGDAEEQSRDRLEPRQRLRPEAHSSGHCDKASATTTSFFFDLGPPGFLSYV